MKNKFRLISILLALCLLLGCLSACVEPCEVHRDVNQDGKCDVCNKSVTITPCATHTDEDDDGICDICGETVITPCETHTDADNNGVCDVCGSTVAIIHDYATEVTMSEGTAKTEVEVKLYIDGDTTHFYVPTSVDSTGVLKARYIAINTPESTGKIEEYGKKAAAFTKEKLSSATSIYIESDDENWNLDSTGGRYLVWVWYKTADSNEYRNLNIEILQNGLAIASSTANNRYGTIAMAALNQGRDQKLNCYSGIKDPDYYTGDAVEITLKELRCNIADYEGIRVAFEAVVTMHSNNSAYVEYYDEETDMYYGMSVYYAYNFPGTGLRILAVGNRVKIVGIVSYYEAGGTYQVSDLVYRSMQPNDPKNIKLISEDNEPAYTLITGEQFLNGTVSVEQENEEEQIVEETFDFVELAMDTTVSMNNLYVRSIYTTTAESSDSKGAMTLTCVTEDNKEITVRTDVLRDNEGNVITAAAYLNKNINVKGLIAYFDGAYQIKVLTPEHITINQ